VIRYSNASLFMSRPTFRRSFAPGAFIPACGQLLVHLLGDCSCPRLSSSQSCARKRFIRRTARSYRIRLHGLMEVLASEQRQLAGIFLIVLIVFFFVRWAACLPIRVLGLFLERLGPHGCIFGGIAVESTVRHGATRQRVQRAAAGHHLYAATALRESHPCSPFSHRPYLNYVSFDL